MPVTRQAVLELLDEFDRAFAAGDADALSAREPAPARVVNGRVTFFVRREADGRWRITLAMNSHSRPVEEIPSATG
jgi:ketosteroid isomerase-like protein